MLVFVVAEYYSVEIQIPWRAPQQYSAKVNSQTKTKALAQAAFFVCLCLVFLFLFV
jgi:hypothetical protein